MVQGLGTRVSGISYLGIPRDDLDSLTHKPHKRNPQSRLATKRGLKASKPKALSLTDSSLHGLRKPQTRNPKPQIRNPKP